MKGRCERGGVKINGLTLDRTEIFHLFRQKGRRAGWVYCQQCGGGERFEGMADNLSDIRNMVLMERVAKADVGIRV